MTELPEEKSDELEEVELDADDINNGDEEQNTEEEYE